MSSRIESQLARIGIGLNGRHPWDLKQVQPVVWQRALAEGNLGFGEAYMDGQWECERLDEFFDHLLRSDLLRGLHSWTQTGHQWLARLANLQSIGRAFQVGQQHYDLGNDFFACMLDRRLTYTCAYWQAGATDLDMAQEHKLDLVCRKLGLAPGMRVLDIGCGWGSFMKFAAERYGVHCTGVTVSAEQVALGQSLCADLPVAFRLQDYRSVNERFDRVVSLGMFEHVGRKNYPVYMDVARRCLVHDGLFLLHTIGRNEPGWGTDPWIHKYIFPNGELPTIAQIGHAAERHFVVEDLHNFGPDYDRTLMAWHANFEANWPQFSHKLGERFHRMWRYYLLSCAGAFRARDLQLWQWVLSPVGRPGTYRRVCA